MVSSGAETSAGLWLDLNLCHRIGHKEQILSSQFVMTGRHKDFSFSTQAEKISLVVLGQNSQSSCSHFNLSSFKDCLHHTNCTSWEFPSGPVVKTSALLLQRAWVQSLVGERRSHMSHSKAKRKKKKIACHFRKCIVGTEIKLLA